MTTTPLTRDRVLAGAVELADQIGIAAFTMRKLAAALNVKPMTIYYHVPNKEQIIDGMVDIVFDEIELPPPAAAWKEAVRTRYNSARRVLNRHPWAAPLMESRTTPGRATLRHHDAVLGCFRRGGLSVEMTAHAYAILDSYLYGFALEEANLPGGGQADMVGIAQELIDAFAADYPYLYELTSQHVMQPGYRFGNSFEFGLDLILDGLETAANRH
jgi:AcrR family transcriptional regulator